MGTGRSRGGIGRVRRSVVSRTDDGTVGQASSHGGQRRRRGSPRAGGGQQHSVQHKPQTITAACCATALQPKLHPPCKEHLPRHDPALPLPPPSSCSSRGNESRVSACDGSDCVQRWSGGCFCSGTVDLSAQLSSAQLSSFPASPGLLPSLLPQRPRSCSASSIATPSRHSVLPTPSLRCCLGSTARHVLHRMQQPSAAAAPPDAFMSRLPAYTCDTPSPPVAVHALMVAAAGH